MTLILLLWPLLHFSVSKRPLKIQFDFGNISDSQGIYKKFLSTLVIPHMYKRIQNSISISQEKQIVIPSSLECDPSVKIPSEVANQPIDFDLYVVFLLKQKTEVSYIANTQPCLMDENKRPFVGVISLNSSYFSLYTENTFYAENIILHEMIHLLGFSQEVLKQHPLGYNSFIIDFGTGISNSLLVQNSVLSAARQHYSCSSLNGLGLENFGSSTTSHYEQLQVGNEIMNPGFTINPILSEFTALLINSTGWY